MKVIATVVYLAGIVLLFYLDRGGRERTSRALWIPTVWTLIAASRCVSAWLNLNAGVSMEQRYLEGNPLDATIFSLLIAGGVVVLAQRATALRQVLRANAPLLVYFGYCAVSLMWSDYSGEALKRWIKMAGDLVMVLVVVSDPKPVAAIRKLFSRVAYLLLPPSLLLIKYFPALGRRLSQSWQQTHIGVAQDKNGLGLLCLVCGLALIWRIPYILREPKSPVRSRRLVAVSAALALAIYLCLDAHSMTSLSCLIGGGMTLSVASSRYGSRHPAAVKATVFAFIAICVFSVFLDSSGMFVRMLGRNPTLTGRTDIWKAVFAEHTAPIIGTGFDSFWLGDRLIRVQSRLPGFPAQEAHNGYIELYITLGWCGLALMATVIATRFRTIFRDARRDRVVGSLSLAFLVTSCVYSISEAGFRELSLSWTVFLLAITVRPRAVAKDRREQEATIVECRDGATGAALAPATPEWEGRPVWFS